ncbi:MAG: ElyC/SanA/YdcF family protein [Candidatus Sulfotelmatobacter sp.]
MRRQGATKRAWLIAFVLLGGFSVGLAVKAGSFLVVDAPRPSDVILVLAGETNLDAEKCLARIGGKSVLIVTSDFHTRLALSIFRREGPGHVYSVAAARDATNFGARWWTHRQWAKTFVDEWLRLLWWKSVDQW